MKFPSLKIIILFCSYIFINIYNGNAQPTLPDIIGKYDSKSTILSWNCQYDNIKSIIIRRSSDSVKDFKEIGILKKPARGIQSFTDSHPLNGRNYYKLMIIFKSGLQWSSNTFIILADNIKEATRHYVVKEYNTNLKKEERNTLPSLSKGDDNPYVKQYNIEETKLPDNTKIPIQLVRSPIDATTASANKIKEYSQVDNFTIISSFIKKDEVTGNIHLQIPNDLKGFRYRIVFLDESNNIVVEIPKICYQNTILEKRNFKSNITYRFVLTREEQKIDEGSFIITL